MKNTNAIRLTLLTVCFFLFACVAQAQPTHIGLQVTASGRSAELSFDNPQVGATISGAFKLNAGVTVIGSLEALRAHQNFLNNGTDLRGAIGARVYPFKFVYAQGTFELVGQFNDAFSRTGKHVEFGAGINIKDALQVGADYLTGDSGIPNSDGARVYADLFLPVSKRVLFKLSGNGKFIRVDGNTPIGLRSFKAQQGTISAGFALRL